MVSETFTDQIIRPYTKIITVIIEGKTKSKPPVRALNERRFCVDLLTLIPPYFLPTLGEPSELCHQN